MFVPVRRRHRVIGAALLIAVAGLGAPLSCTLDVEGTGSSFTANSSGGGAGGGVGGGGAAGGEAGGGGAPGTGGAGGSPAICGDGVVEGSEGCDDGNEVAEDGCDGCAVVGGYGCAGEPSECALIEPVVVTQQNLGLDIPDDERYDGTRESMTCVTLAVPAAGAEAVVRRVELTVGIDHTYIGDLAIKVFSPAGTVTTVLSRPGVMDPQDSSFEDPNGDSSNLSSSHPIRFADDATTLAEMMGSTLGAGDVVCKDDNGLCDYLPSPDSGPGTNLGDFVGEPPAGDWQVCFSDGDDGDDGTVALVTLSVLAW